jgi:hypothetical protein
MRPIAFILLLFARPLDGFAQADYFPVALDNRWTYKSVFLISTNVFTESVVNIVEFKGEQYFLIDAYRMSEDVPVRKEGGKVFTFVDTAKYLFYDFSPETGSSWIAPDVGLVLSKTRLLGGTIISTLMEYDISTGVGRSDSRCRLKTACRYRSMMCWGGSSTTSSTPRWKRGCMKSDGTEPIIQPGTT